MRSFLIVFALASFPAFADCPDAPDIKAELDALIAAANAAKNDMQGQAVSREMWQLWLQAPDAAAQEVLDKGMRARSSYDYITALDAFDRLVSYCPDYAEGYNQRAFIHFLRGDFDSALTDLDATLDISPNHVGAQSGRALTLMNLGLLPEARMQLRAALKNNPWLSERFLMNEGGPLAPVGKDI